MTLHRLLLAFACLLLSVHPLAAQFQKGRLPAWKEAPADYKGKYQWGVRGVMKPADQFPELAPFLKELPGNPKVVKVTGIILGGTGAEDGLQPGDIILAVNGRPASAPMKEEEDLLLKLWRPDGGKGKILELRTHLGHYYHTMRDQYRDAPGAREFQDFVPVWWDEVCAILSQDDLAPHLADTLQRLVKVDTLVDRYRLPIYRYTARNPFKIEAVAASVVRRLKAPDGADDHGLLRGTLDTARYLLDFQEAPAWPQDARAPDLQTMDALLAHIESVLAKAAAHHARAFAALSNEERDFILKHRDGLMQSFLNHHMLSYEPDLKAIENYVRLLELMAKIDLAELFAQARIASTLTTPAFLDAVRRLAAKDAAKPVVAARQTPYGKIVVAGTADNRHTDDAAVLIDLGGDDLYLNRQGASIPGQVPTAILVDLGGNDRYENTDNFSQGCGDLGVGILHDLAGDDIYIGMRAVQGACFGGIGILLDTAGNDTYRSLSFSQGCALFGAGLLLDRAGNDRYEGLSAVQAVGSVKGVGILSDLAGDDTYYCKGGSQTSYQTRGHFEGWGQGIGFGLRPYASGGFGLLADWNGRDAMEGGAFTQGGGYFYGFGMLFNGGHDDDFYIGTRYAQGFCAHQAVGVFIEEGGNDKYRTTHCVAQGLSWDETVVLFLDQGGNDDYDAGTGGFSLGASAHNGILIFRDLEGRDQYGPSRAASAGGNHYHGGHSLSIFIDEGHADDTYHGRKNNSTETGPDDFIFIDK